MNLQSDILSLRFKVRIHQTYDSRGTKKVDFETFGFQVPSLLKSKKARKNTFAKRKFQIATACKKPLDTGSNPNHHINKSSEENKNGSDNAFWITKNGIGVAPSAADELANALHELVQKQSVANLLSCTSLLSCTEFRTLTCPPPSQPQPKN